MNEELSTEIYKKLIGSGIAFLLVLFGGTHLYWLIGRGDYEWFDCFYMTVITISTIGYGEVIDMASHPEGRFVTIFLAFGGIGLVTYMLSNITALVVEGNLNETFKKRKMERRIKKLKDHFIICGVGHVGVHILDEITRTNRAAIAIDIDPQKIEDMLDLHPNQLYVEGDAADDDILLSAGIDCAQGLFAATDNDSQNLVISLTARHLNPAIRVITRCSEPRNIEKIRKAGASAVVSTAAIGGMRMASEMMRPTVVSFLDTMMRDEHKNLRVEEINVSERFVGQELSALSLKNYPNSLLIALRTPQGWTHNPPRNQIIEPNTILIFMTTPDERSVLEKNLS